MAIQSRIFWRNDHGKAQIGHVGNDFGVVVSWISACGACECIIILIMPLLYIVVLTHLAMTSVIFLHHIHSHHLQQTYVLHTSVLAPFVWDCSVKKEYLNPARLHAGWNLLYNCKHSTIKVLQGIYPLPTHVPSLILIPYTTEPSHSPPRSTSSWKIHHNFQPQK
jgi:hypothetical protein